MSRFDLVIFGATGFTGKQAVIEVTKVAKKYGLTWAVAGRSESKLQALMQEVAKKSGEDHSNTKLIIADVSDDPSLEAMCRQASVVVNCCGPYRLYGEPVVRAAIHCKAHYVDVSGEPQFIETMQLKYDTLAREAGVYIVSACGMDSVPNDMGVVYMQQQFDGTLNSVESYLMAKVDPKYSDEARRGVIHYGTWESLVHSLATHSELAVLRKKLYPQRLPTFEPKLKPRGIHKNSNVWCVPFLGADASIVYRTQRHLYESGGNRPVQFKPYVKMGNLLTTIAAVFAGAILYLMSMTSFTRNILLNHPRIFSLGFVSKEGPTENVMNNTYYKFELYGVGWGKGDDEGSKPTKKIAVKVSGMNPGYGATVSGLLYSAVAILKQKDKMPANGGVMTTGTAFANTDLVKNLYDNNMKFEVVDTDGAKTK